MNKYTICCPQCDQITKVDEETLKVWCGFCQDFVFFRETQKIKILCNCGRALSISFFLQGKKVRCNGCQETVSIPFLPVKKDKQAIEASSDVNKKVKLGFSNKIFILVPKDKIKDASAIKVMNEKCGIVPFDIENENSIDSDSEKNFYYIPLFISDIVLDTNFESLSLYNPKRFQGQWWVPVSENKAKTYLGIDSPEDLIEIDKVRNYLSTADHNALLGLEKNIQQASKLFWNIQKKELAPKQEDVSITGLLQALPAEEENLDIVEEEVSEGTIVRLVNQILITAFRDGASDIHIEMGGKQQKETLVRFRIDGICQVYRKLPKSVHSAMISRLKIMAELDITNHRIPQYGKFLFDHFKNEYFRIRVTTLPVSSGYEEAILRILPNDQVTPIHQMGMTEDTLERYKKKIHSKHGLILTVGPTGSGKTTTLHASLQILKNDRVKIVTAEDPVEITQDGITQVQINPKGGLNFVEALRGFLRSDPDIIMVGEIRDKDSAIMATQAALTGHLVFSSLHTNSASETLLRILDLGVNPYNFADALQVVLAQRLVRKLCAKCRKSVEEMEKQELIRHLESEYANEYDYDYKIQYDAEITLYKANGCDFCNSGYKGRIGIYELLVASEEVKAAIRNQKTSVEIKKTAMGQGMHTLNQDAIIKTLSGHIDLRQMKLVSQQE